MRKRRGEAPLACVPVPDHHSHLTSDLTRLTTPDNEVVLVSCQQPFATCPRRQAFTLHVRACCRVSLLHRPCHVRAWRAPLWGGPCASLAVAQACFEVRPALNQPFCWDNISENTEVPIVQSSRSKAVTSQGLRLERPLLPLLHPISSWLVIFTMFTPLAG